MKKYNRARFFDDIRGQGKLFTRMNQQQVDCLNAFMDQAEQMDMLPAQLAYIMATTYHETDRKMTPIEEYGRGRGKNYGKKLMFSGKPYAFPDKLYYGRGYVQLTWYENYQKAEKAFGIPGLLERPELALDPANALKIAFGGMAMGLFTGRRLDQYITANKVDFVGARAIINGKDKAELIAGYGKSFMMAMA